MLWKKITLDSVEHKQPASESLTVSSSYWDILPGVSEFLNGLLNLLIYFYLLLRLIPEVRNHLCVLSHIANFCCSSPPLSHSEEVQNYH